MSVTTFWQQYKFRILGATFGILFHLSAIDLIFIAERIVLLILVIVDFPITLLLFHVDWLGIQVWENVVRVN